jgi:hypothetical protein
MNYADLFIIYINELIKFVTLSRFVFTKNLENTEKSQNRALKIIN